MNFRELATAAAALTVWLILSISGAVAQDLDGGVPPIQVQEASTPNNSTSKNYGRGWDCDIGYRESDGSCNAVDVPDNAYATGKSYGSGWECLRG
jgi:hypothetical protein